MTFESRILAFAERFLSDRTFDLIVGPAVADLQFDGGAARTANRLAVIRAVAGGLADDVKRGLGGFFSLALLPASYYLVLLTICFDAFSGWSDFIVVVGSIVAMSLVPVMVCFWPERHVARSAD